jgi:predicted nucleic acid-binding protein
LSKAVADTSIFIARETGCELGELPEKIAVSVITVAELELGVLRASDPEARARRLSTLSRVQSIYPLLPIGPVLTQDSDFSSFAEVTVLRV